MSLVNNVKFLSFYQGQKFVGWIASSLYQIFNVANLSDVYGCEQH